MKHSLPNNNVCLTPFLILILSVFSIINLKAQSLNEFTSYMNNVNSGVNTMNQYMGNFRPSPEQIQQREAAAKIASTAQAERQKVLDEYRASVVKTFQKDYLDKYLAKAEAGNLEYRNILIFRLSEIRYPDLGNMVPNWKNWLREGIKNNNPDATIFVGMYALRFDRAYNLDLTPAQGTRILENLVNSDVNAIKAKSTLTTNYKADVMTALAAYYDTDATPYRGGEDAEKALLYYAKAAENGSPNAMYNLGKIYLYNEIAPKYHVKYKVKKNEKTAFNWFSKSLENNNYADSKFQAMFKNGAYFDANTYDEMIKMYQKGIGCDKDKKKAEAIAIQKEDYLLQQKLVEKQEDPNIKPSPAGASFLQILGR
jgi:TPR repeat protein